MISHDARVTARVAIAARMQGVRIPHVAWGFNFTTLPQGPHRRLMAASFAQVDRFVAYSTRERSLYPEYFGIDPRRIDVVLWGAGHPPADPPDTAVEPGDCICALGSNARDYRTLFAAIKRLPEISLVAVLHRANVKGLKVPPNVRLRFDISRGKANNILAFSGFTVLPLAGRDVACGHVTLVAAMYFSKATIITDSLGVADYVEEGVNSLLVPPGDVDVLALRIRELWSDRERARQLGAAGYEFAIAKCSEEQIIHHLKEVLLAYGLPA